MKWNISWFIIFILTVVLLYVSLFKHRIVEKFNTKYAFCLITIKPNDIWLEFLQSFTSTYDVYIMIDDNTYDCTENIIKYPNIRFIQIDDVVCKNNGYSNSSYIIKSEPISWDKALYYFTLENRNYNNVWFCEDDVYIRSVELIENIDNKHYNADLICEKIVLNTTGNLNTWPHWSQAEDYIDLPWAKSMVCCCRLSLKLLDSINMYTNKHNKLSFIELLFPTIAHQNNMIIETPPQLNTIHYNKKWNKDNIDKAKIYHPFKTVDDHVYMRNI